MTSGVNTKMAMVVYDNLCVSIQNNPSKAIAQDVINAAWSKFDVNDKTTWPDASGIYLTFSIMEISGKPYKSIDRNYFDGGDWNHSTDDVVCYAPQKLLEPVL